ncbi:uncharacterized protein [Pocillopora verrucosa]|uniref:uncharacterized protein n=1 Tax=Pocillopora verrucosa TaxID=203993 RepID=UPI0027974656|nr:uncharacterized protein LOC131770295 [Pocillopora verrucosa]
MATRRPAHESETSSQNDSDTSEPQPSTAKKRKPATLGAAKYRTTFKVEWSNLYPVKAVRNDKHSFYCVPCLKTIRCDHQGLKDVKDHCNTESHKLSTKAAKNQPSVAGMFGSGGSVIQSAVTRAEVLTTNFLIQHNLPLATSDHLGPLFRAVFPDSEIAKQYGCARTKTMAIINKALGPHCHRYVVQHCQKHPFSIGIDGSSDTDVEKMNPATVRIFDVERAKTVTSHFYHMCVTSGRDASKAETLFGVVQEKLETDEIPWNQVVSLSVDNTNSMVGAHNSLASHFKAKNPETYVLGCPCHLAHIAASRAHDEFAKIIGISAEELLIDQYYWFDKSTKRKGILLEYMQFCNQEYGKILKHSSTRWLSLERCVQRTLEKYTGLKSYFLSEDAGDARFKRLQKAFENPLTEVSLFFHNASIPLFTNFNKLLQSDEPSIHIVYDSVIKLANTLGNRVIKVEVMKKPLNEINLQDPTIYIPLAEIHLGGTTKFTLQRLLNQGEISQTAYTRFLTAAHEYFKAAFQYVLSKFPITDELLKHARWINVQKRSQAKWESVEYFLSRFKSALNTVNIDEMYDEFRDYQSLTDEDIGVIAWKEAKVVDGLVNDQEIFHYRVDILWWYMSQMVIPESSAKRFCHLQKVAELVVLLPHSNAGEERLFSMVRKNKTDSRSSLKLEGTLSNLLAMKLQYPEETSPCFKFNPDENLLSSAKKAAKDYNREH